MQSLIKAVLNFIYFNYSCNRGWTRSPGKIIRFTLGPAFPGFNKRNFHTSTEIFALILAETAEFGNSKIMLKIN